jgi:hypothetical protein
MTAPFVPATSKTKLVSQLSLLIRRHRLTHAEFKNLASGLRKLSVLFQNVQELVKRRAAAAHYPFVWQT